MADPSEYLVHTPGGAAELRHADGADLVTWGSHFSEGFWRLHPDVDHILAKPGEGDEMEVRIWLKVPADGLDTVALGDRAPDRPFDLSLHGEGDAPFVILTRHPAVAYVETLTDLDPVLSRTPAWAAKIWLKPA